MTSQLSPDIASVLERRLVQPAFQPVLDLDRDVVVGYEALARGTDGASPGALFSAATKADRVAELDWLCRERAVELARSAGMRHPLSLLVNAEPETLLGSHVDAERWAAFGDLRCYAEVTERRLLERPAELLRAVEQVRAQDWGVALDDVGADPASLSLLPVLLPDIIKLDMSLLHSRPESVADSRVAQVLHAALAQAEQTGAVIVAEGIETEQHLDLARAYGAHYGQGYLLGRPAALPDTLVSPPVAVPLLRRDVNRTVPPSPFAVVASSRPTRSLGTGAVQETVRQLLAHACRLDPAPVVLLCLDDPAALDPGLVAVLEELAGRTIVRVSSHRPAHAPWVTDVLGDNDPAREDLDVVVMSPHFAGAFVSRPSLPDDGRRDGALVMDRTLVSAAAHALLQRAAAPGAGAA